MILPYYHTTILPCAQGTCPLPPPPLSHCRSNFLPYSHSSGGGYILYGGGIYYLDNRYRGVRFIWGVHIRCHTGLVLQAIQSRNQPHFLNPNDGRWILTSNWLQDQGKIWVHNSAILALMWWSSQDAIGQMGFPQQTVHISWRNNNTCTDDALEIMWVY